MTGQYGAQDIVEQELSEPSHSLLFPIFKKGFYFQPSGTVSKF
jgi:hypothetical protein